MAFYPEDRLALFIDGANFYSAARGLGFDIDYKRLLTVFQGKGRLIRAFYYTAFAEDQEYSPIRSSPDARTSLLLKKRSADRAARPANSSSENQLPRPSRLPAACSMPPSSRRRRLAPLNASRPPLDKVLPARAVRSRTCWKRWAFCCMSVHVSSFIPDTNPTRVARRSH